MVFTNSNWMLVWYWPPTYFFCFQVQMRFLGPRTYHHVNGCLPQAPSQVPRRMLLLVGLLVVCLSTPIKTRLTKQVPWQNKATYLCVLTLVCDIFFAKPSLFNDPLFSLWRSLSPRMKIRTRGESDLTTTSAKIVEKSIKKSVCGGAKPGLSEKKGLPSVWHFLLLSQAYSMILYFPFEDRSVRVWK